MIGKEDVTKITPAVIRGAIFDMDGTLLDSMPIWEHFASAYVTSRGLCPAKDLDERLATATLDEAAAFIAREYDKTATPAEVREGIDRTVRLLYDRVEPKRGVPELLARFSSAGVRMALATLTDREDVLRVLSRLGLLRYLSDVFTCAEVGAPKTRPDIFETALKALGTRKAETPVFEDALYAIRTAHDAGFPTVAVYDTSADSTFAEASALSFLAVRDYHRVSFERYLGKKT